MEHLAKTSISRLPNSLLMLVLQVSAVFGARVASSPETTATNVVLILDDSKSMPSAGFHQLADAVETLDSSLNWGLVAFDDTARLLMPLPSKASAVQTHSIGSAIRQVQALGRWTNPTEGLRVALSAIEVGSSPSDRKVIILYSDGFFDPVPSESKDSLLRYWREQLIPRCVSADVTVSAFVPVRGDMATLQPLVSATGGRVYGVPDARLLSAALSGTLARVMEPQTQTERRAAQVAGTSFDVPLLALAAASFLLLVAILVLAIVRRGRARVDNSLTSPIPATEDNPELSGLMNTAIKLASDLDALRSDAKMLSTSLEYASANLWLHEKKLVEKSEKTVGAILDAADQLAEMKTGLPPSDTKLRECLEFMDELLGNAIRSAGLEEIAVQVGGPYDALMHEPLPENSDKPRGTILRMVRSGYVTRSKEKGETVFRLAKVIVSKGSGGGTNV